MMSIDKKTQFSCNKKDWLKGLDFSNWTRYYFLIKDSILFDRNNILEIGGGSGLVRNCLEPLVSNYTTLDINDKLSPEIIADVCENVPKLQDKFDCIIAADILEHIPFNTVEPAVKNLYSYLERGGYALITIPHRRSNFMYMTPHNIPKFYSVPTGFLSLGGFYRRFIKRKIWIDPCHRWEIGDGNIKVKDVNKVFLDCGFKIEKFEEIYYVDYWVLKK